ncbi:toll/interleukin-1 receptor domain-containing protein [Ktedonobacteria bacterium brp13]|nr:toll/interleukin-1 receptor domain-containing protein [Ktedonobacteria bacterium brp13]
MIGTPAPELRYAICIGVNTHPLYAQLPALPRAEDDARKVDASLAALGIPAERRRLLLGSEATVAAINEAFTTLLCSQPVREDAVIVYYAGYLVPLVETIFEGRGVLRSDVCLAASDLRNVLSLPVQRRNVPLPGLQTIREDYIDESRARSQLLVFDCYTAPSQDTVQKASVEPLWVEERLKQLLQNNLPGRVAIANYADEQVMFAAGTYEQRFSTHIIRALRGNTQAGKHTLSAFGLFDFVSQQLRPLRQHPILSCTLKDDFSVADYATPAKAKIDKDLTTAKLSMPEEVAMAMPITDRQPVLPVLPVTPITPITPITPAIPVTPPPVSLLYPPDKKQADILPETAIGAQTTEPLKKLSPPTKVVVCFAGKDQRFRDELYAYLQPLERSKKIMYWDKTKIDPGDVARDRIVQNVSSARIAIIFVNVDFFNSPYVEPDIFPLLLDNKIKLFPVLVGPYPLNTNTAGELLAERKFVHGDDEDKPLSSCSKDERAAVWVRIAEMVAAASL